MKIKWIDLSSIGLALGSYRDANNNSGLSIVDTKGIYHKEIAAMGFHPASGQFSKGIFLKSDHRITPAELRNVLGDDAVKFFEAERSVINANFAKLVKDVTKSNANALFAQQRPIGVNYLGEVVQESIAGRYVIRNVDGKSKVVNESVVEPGMFLRANSHDALRQVTKGFVMRITKRNEHLRKKHILRLMDVSNVGDYYSEREYQEAIESSLNELFADEMKATFGGQVDVDPLAAYDVANKIYVGMPDLKVRTPNSIANQQYSSPLPLGALAQSILARRDELSGADVLDPTIGNGNLVSILNAGNTGQQRCSVFGVEIDPARVEQLDHTDIEVVLGDATQIDFKNKFSKPNGFDFVIANPPFGGTEKIDVTLPAGSLITSLETARLDHLILLKSLNARTAEGRAVFITGADSIIGRGEIKGRSKHLLTYLHDHYEVEGVVDVSGELYKKQGASYPLRMYVIGARREHPLEMPVPEALPVMKSYDELRDWAAGVIAHQSPIAFDATDLFESPEDDAIVKGAVNTRGKTAASKSVPKEKPVSLVTQELALEEAVVNEEGALSDDGMIEEVVARAGEKEDRIEYRTESKFQQLYVAFSNVGEASTMIPQNLSGPVFNALMDIKEAHGDIDAYVGKELDFSFNDLEKYFSPEQVDVLAMIFHAQDRGLGFLLADQMGVGKGRVLAAVARRERLSGRIPVFVTVTANLFSDFLERDLVAIGSRDLFPNPFIVNEGCKTIDENGDVVAQAMRRTEYKRYAESGDLPPDTDIVLLTYSQICRKPESHLTSRYMRVMATRSPITMLLDESHTGAGASNTSDNLNAMISAIGNRGGVIYSSGTPIKGAKNLRLYRKILPLGIDPDDLLEAVNSDPLSLQEALNTEIAIQGCLISRELDSTGIEKEFILSPNVERNRAIADQMSEIMTGMSYLSGDIARIVAKMNKQIRADLEKVPEAQREGERMGVTSMNFGSRLHELSRQFLLALKAPDVVEHALIALRANKKPIITLQHTGEAMLVDFMARANSPTAGDEEVKKLSSVIIEKPVSFKDLMYKYLEKISWMTIQGRYGGVTHEMANGEEVTLARKRIADLIAELPDDLPITPLDYFREAMAKEGYKVGEVSGRSLMVSTMEDGRAIIEQIPGRTDKTRVNRVVREFNNGDLDVLALTGSGSTGLSVHASPAVGRDVRIRRMIKWEMQPNIAAERQMDGRHNRTGQIVSPEYCIPGSGLIADDRLSMMFNNKNRSLTSSTVANRDSKELIKEAPDLLNVVGDIAAAEMLYETPGLARKLDIDLPKDDTARADKPALWYSGKLSGRIGLLTVAEGEALYADWQSRFVEKLDALKAEGRNPLEVEVLDWQASEIDRIVYMGAASKTDNKKSQFNSPVYLTTLKYNQPVQAVRASMIDKKIADNTEGESVFAADSTTSTIINILARDREDILKRHLSQRFTTVEQALADKDTNEVKKTAAKLDWLTGNLPFLKNGTVYMRPDIDGIDVPHVIVRYTTPSKTDRFARLGEYICYSMKAGSGQMEMTSLSALFSENIELESDAFADHPKARAEFDAAKDGVIEKKAMVLNGNLFDATILNLRERLGRKIVYTNEAGLRQHGIIVASSWTMSKLMAIPERVRDANLAAQLIESNQVLSASPSSDPKNKARYLEIGSDRNGTVILRVPSAKIHGGEVFLDPALSKIAGKEKANKFKLEFSLINAKMCAAVPHSKVKALIAYLINEKKVNFYISDREVLKNARANLGKENERTNAV